MADETETLDDKRKRLIEARAKLEEALLEKAKAREVEALELELSLSTKLGPRGEAWDMLATSEGPIAVKLGEAVLYKKLRACYKGTNEPTLEDLESFVLPSLVSPSRDRFLEIVDKRPAVYLALSSLLADLYVAKERDTRGK
jgi:hypothetical protein